MKTLATHVVAAGITIGPGHPAVFLPDIGTFFNQDVERALRLIDQVSDSGAAFIKGEVLHDASICLDSDLLETITSRQAVVTKERYRDVILRKVLPLSTYERLFQHAVHRQLHLALSVYDFAGLDFAVAQGASLIKIASSNVVHRPLIERAAGCGLPILIDTGGATPEEVSRAVGWFADSGGRALIVEHSPAAPPAPVSRHNLGRLRVFQQAFGCPVGLSDHHAGVEMLFAAIALGASVVEKGVVPDEVERDQDVAHALPASALAATIRQCADVATAIQDPPGGVTYAGHPARMGLVAARDLATGHVIVIEDLAYAFPRLGVPIEQVSETIGLSLARDVKRGQPIPWAAIRGSGA